MNAKRYIPIALVMLGALAASCNKEAPALPEDEICVAGEGTGPATRAATVFDGAATLIDEAYGGGNFTLNAYLAGTNTVFFADEWVNYFADNAARPWQFRVGNTFVRHIWPPNNGRLDFFAYMPYKQGQPSYIPSISYDSADGPSFTCDLPVTKAYQDTTKEFIYAYSTGINKNTNSQKVTLQFHHPFAAIYFKLMQGHRNMTVHNISITNIHSQGTFTYANTPQWTPDDDRAGNDFVIDVEKIIPGEINFGVIIDGPFIMMPQDLAVTGSGCSEMVVEYSWLTHVPPFDHEEMRMPIPDVDWEPGKVYIYNMNLGDNKEEIMFKVSVEAWDIMDYHIPIDVE